MEKNVQLKQNFILAQKQNLSLGKMKVWFCDASHLLEARLSAVAFPI